MALKTLLLKNSAMVDKTKLEKLLNSTKKKKQHRKKYLKLSDAIKKALRKDIKWTYGDFIEQNPNYGLSQTYSACALGLGACAVFGPEEAHRLANEGKLNEPKVAEMFGLGGWHSQIVEANDREDDDDTGAEIRPPSLRRALKTIRRLEKLNRAKGVNLATYRKQNKVTR